MQTILTILQKVSEHGGFMEVNLMNINDYVYKLLKSKSFRKDEYRSFITNDYAIADVEGIIRPELLTQVIRKAKRNKSFRVLLSDILTYIDSESISDQNFQLLLTFHKKQRTTYLSCIGHSSLSFYQMQVLNEYPLALEAFSWLFDNICRYDIFTSGDMLRILEKNPDVQPRAIQICIDSAIQKYGDSAKLNVAKKWVNRAI